MKPKAKVQLTREVYDIMRRFYSYPLSEKWIDHECFSHPVMASHWCNPQAKKEGGELCGSCRHDPAMVCEITCHCHHVCLAAFGARLGLGGDQPVIAIMENLKISYGELYGLVQEALKAKPKKKVVEQKPEPEPIVITAEPKPSKKKAKTPDPEPTDEVIEDPEVFEAAREKGDLLSLSEAADAWGCSYVNVYNHTKKGNLTRVRYNNKNYVWQKDLDHFKPRLRTRKNQGESEPKPEPKTEEAQVPFLCSTQR